MAQYYCSNLPSLCQVIVERYQKEKDLPILDKTKFLVPEELTLSQFVTIIRSERQLIMQTNHIVTLNRLCRNTVYKGTLCIKGRAVGVSVIYKIILHVARVHTGISSLIIIFPLSMCHSSIAVYSNSFTTFSSQKPHGPCQYSSFLPPGEQQEHGQPCDHHGTNLRSGKRRGRFPLHGVRLSGVFWLNDVGLSSLPHFTVHMQCSQVDWYITLLLYMLLSEVCIVMSKMYFPYVCSC